MSSSTRPLPLSSNTSDLCNFPNNIDRSGGWGDISESRGWIVGGDSDGENLPIFLTDSAANGRAFGEEGIMGGREEEEVGCILHLLSL